MFALEILAWVIVVVSAVLMTSIFLTSVIRRFRDPDGDRPTRPLPRYGIDYAFVTVRNDTPHVLRVLDWRVAPGEETRIAVPTWKPVSRSSDR